MTTEPLDLNNNEALTILLDAAGTVHAKYPLTSRDDLYQEAWTWLLRHTQTVTTALEDGKVGRRRLNHLVTQHLVAVARADKATQLGYDLDDEAFYTPGVVEELLPLVFSAEALLKPAAEAGSRPSGDPASGGTWLVTVLDVRRAWVGAALTAKQVAALEGVYRDGIDTRELAAMYATDETEIEKAVKYGLRRMVDFLGGSRGGCPRTCVDCIERKGEASG